MFPQRNPIAMRGAFTIHRGKLAHDDSRAFWGEGPAGDGVRRPLASFWNESDARSWLAARGVEGGAL